MLKYSTRLSKRVLFIFIILIVALSGIMILGMSGGSAAMGEIKVEVDQLNVRSGPSEGFEVIGSVSRAEHYPVILEQDGWYKIDLGFEQEGWVAGWLVQFNPATAEEGGYEGVVTASALNVRSGPDTSFSKVGQLPHGEIVRIIHSEQGWHHIQFENREGWVAAEYVNTNGSEQPPAEPHQSADPNRADISTKTIVIDPGHGGRDSGAIGSNFNTFEKTVNLQVAHRLQSKLEATGAEVIMTRTSDNYLSLEDRVYIGVQNQADVFISIHHNTYHDPQMNGSITYFHSEADQLLANAIHPQLITYGGLNDLDPRHERFMVIQQNPIPSVLIELGFLSNYGDELTIRTTQFQENAATGIMHGLIHYFEEK